MATPSTAFISIDQIVYSYLLRHGKTIHAYYKILSLAAEAVRELSINTLQLVNHKILTKGEDETHFVLPDDYTDWVSAGFRQGDFWRPVGVSSNRLMPFPKRIGDGEFNSEFGNGLDTEGGITNWTNPQTPSVEASFSGDDFSSSDMSTTDVSGQSESSDDSYCVPYWGYPCAGAYNMESIAINAAKGLIMVPHEFPSNELYLVYVSIGAVDTMTHIPIQAQAAIEAYISWKYAQNKRNGLVEGGALKAQFDQQHRLLRARLNPITTTDIKRIAARYTNGEFGEGGYGLSGGAGYCGGSGGGSTTTIITTGLDGKSYTGNGTDTQVFAELSGHTLESISMGSGSYTTEHFTQNGATVTWTLPGQLFTGTIFLTWRV